MAELCMTLLKRRAFREVCKNGGTMLQASFACAAGGQAKER